MFVYLIRFIFCLFSIITFAKFSMPVPVVITKNVIITKRAPSYISFGNIIAKNSANILTQTGGIVAAINTESGGEIANNQLILTLKNDNEIAALKQAKAQFDQANWVFKKTESLYQQKAASALEFEKAKQENLTALANVEINQAKLNDKIIKAPFAGSLGIIKPHIGDYLTKGSFIVDIHNNEVVWVDFSVPQDLSNKVHVADKVSIFSSLNNNVKSIEATITAIGAKLNQNHQMLIRAKLKNTPKWLKIGSYCSIQIPIGEARSVAIIPSMAIKPASSSNKVFVVKNNIAIEKDVVLGSLLDNGLIEVASGLSENEDIIVLGGFKVFNGQKVLVKKDK